MQPPPMDPDQIALYVAEKAAEDERIGRRKDFWLRMIWIALVGTVVPVVAGFVISVFRIKAIAPMMHASGKMDERMFSHMISDAMLPTFVGAGMSSLVFVFLIVALVLFFSLPRARTRMAGQGF